MNSKVFLSPHFKDTCDPQQLDTLIELFKAYKIDGATVDQFGRDAPYDFPVSLVQADMHHIHVKDKSSKKWELQKLNFYKTSDTALIYCKGFMNPNYYLLLGFIVDAHETCRRNPMYLLTLAEIADAFRNKF